MKTALQNKGDWTEDELDLIVAMYFSMLTPEPDVQRGWKAARLLDLDDQIGRGVNSIGRKLSNITYVASRLGLPPLQGYGALPNIQQAIYPAIQRYLVNNPATLADDAFLSLAGVSQHGGVSEPAIALPPEQWVAPTKLLPTDVSPPLSDPKAARPEGLVRLIRKFDPAARDQRNRLLGRLGEQLVLNHEIARLIAADHNAASLEG